MLNIFLLNSAEVTESTIDLVKLITIIAISLLAIILLVVSAQKRDFNTRSIVFAAICIALSFVLSFIKYPMPYGGSITLASLVPLLIYSYFYGPVKGLLAGIVYGLLQFVQDSWFLTPTQFILDYILAFSSIALAGAYKNIIKNKYASVVTGVLSVGIFRLAMHTFAGIIFFNAGYVYPELPQTSAFIYSFVYNVIVVIPDILIALGVIIYMVTTGYYDKIKEKIVM